jgi:hypothetical protein
VEPVQHLRMSDPSDPRRSSSTEWYCAYVLIPSMTNVEQYVDYSSYVDFSSSCTDVS